MKRLASDWYAILEGCFLVSLGICFLNASTLLVGGTAGVAVIVNTWIPLTFGSWFFLINLPFFFLALRQMGKTFSLRSLLSIGIVSALSDLLGYFIRFEALPTALSAMIGGGLIGVGLIVIFRFGSSLGGVNILALFLEERFGIHAGKVMLCMDMLVALGALALFDMTQVLYSALSFVVLSSVLGRYHKKAPLKRQQDQQSVSNEPTPAAATEPA